MKQKMEVDPLNITILGFHHAGWGKYCTALRDSGIHVYTTTNCIYDLQTSIYGKAHYKEALVEKSRNKSKDPKSVETALKHWGEILIRIKEPETRKAIIEYIASIERIEDDVVKASIESVEAQESPTQAMVELALDMTEYADPPLTESDNVVLAGYAFARSIAMHHNLENLFYGDDKQLLKEVKEWASYVSINTKPIDTQATLAQSKRLIVDTLQLNLNRLQQGEPLIPIHMVVSAKTTNQMERFSPNWGLVTNKIGFFLTNAEIRMVYKLSYEIDDPLINTLMQQHVTFINTLDNNFEQISSPWESHGDAWRERTRSKGKPAYRERTAEEIQPWIKELIDLSKATAQKLAINENQSSSMPNFERPEITADDSTARMIRLMPSISPVVKNENNSEQEIISSTEDTTQPKNSTAPESEPLLKQDETEIDPTGYIPL